MPSFGQKPFGIKDVKLVTLSGTPTVVDLPSARTLTFTERITSGELKGDDALQSVVAYSDAVEWQLEAGGISLEAYALMTGRTAVAAGTTPNATVTLNADAAAHFPYFKIYGKSVGDTSKDDIHVKLFKAKLTRITGTFGNDQFFITQASGIAVDDGTNGLFEFVQNETGANLPTT